MNKIEEVFNSLNEFQVDTSDLSKSSKTIKLHYYKIFRDLLSEFKQFRLKKDSHLYRVRKNEGDKLFMYPDELSHPPANKTKLGRVNLPSRPVFYCSDKLSTSILELKPVENEYITVAESILSEELLLAVIGDLNRYKTEGKQSAELKLFYEKITPIITKLINKDADYLFTAELADLIFTDTKFKGIIYPSYYSNTKADNFALLAKGLDQKLALAKVTVMKITERKNEHNVTVKCIASSDQIDPEGQFIWKKVESCNSHSINFDNELIHAT
jgi:hypothetical protein